MHTQDQRPEWVRGEHTPTKEKPLSEAQQGQNKKHKPIMPLTLVFKALSAIYFYALVWQWSQGKEGGHHGL
jgi:hypothetical protein